MLKFKIEKCAVSLGPAQFTVFLHAWYPSAGPLETLGLQPNALRQFLGSCSPDLGLRAWSVGWSTPGDLIQYSPNQGMTARKLLHKRSWGKSNSPNPKPKPLNPKPQTLNLSPKTPSP